MGDNVGHGHVISGVLPGGGVGSGIAQPVPYTWLSLNRYAQILGLALPNFNTAVCTPYFTRNQCSEIFYKYGWQGISHVSRMDIVDAILSAEEDLLNVVGFPLAPTWINEEVHPVLKHHRPEMSGYGGMFNTSYQRKGLHANNAKVIGGGQRAVTLVGAAVIPTYIDLDADGFFETARVSVATTQTEVNKVKVYYHAGNGDQEWEIRPCRRKSISAGVFTADFWTWQLINPDLYEEFPTTDDLDALDIAGNPPAHVLSEVDVYYEYNNFSAVSAQLWWEPYPSDCLTTAALEGEHVSQDGCLMVRDTEQGYVIPAPATWDTTNLEWVTQCLSVQREPDLVKLWYYAGDMDTKYFQGRSYDPLSDYWARIIAMVATARLDKDLCGCDCTNSYNLFKSWREDMALSNSARQYVSNFQSSEISNPLGTHAGEIMAWRKIQPFVKLY